MKLPMNPKNKKIKTPAVKHLMKVDAILALAIEQIDIEENRKPNKNHFKALVESIVSQQLSVKASDTIFKRFVELFVKSKAIKSIRGFPTPDQILKMSDEKLRAVGLSGSKVKYIKDLSQKVHTNEVKINALQKMSNEEVIQHLIQVKGIGRWTGEMFLMFSLARPDVFSHGDLGLRNAIKKLYKFKAPPTENQIEKIVAKWSPYKTLASRYLWKSLELK